MIPLELLAVELPPITTKVNNIMSGASETFLVVEEWFRRLG